MRVRMFDNAAHYERDRDAIDAAIRGVLDSGRLIMGPAVKQFEDEFAHYCGVGYAAGVTSGTSALLLALRALDIGPGDEVITVANSDIPTSHAITLTGARVVWADIDPRSFNIDAASLEAAITPRTRAIIPVHLYGLPADMAAVLDVAERHGIAVVEDACLAPGARYHGQRVGSFGRLAAFSTAPGKPFGGIGSGGVVTTDDPALFEKLNQLRNYGRERPLYKEFSAEEPKPMSRTVAIGYNERIDTTNAAVLSIRLKRLDDDLRRRREIAAMYTEMLRGAPVGLAASTDDCEPAWFVFTVRVQQRDRVYDALYREGIEVARHYLPANHLDACYRSLGYRAGSLPETESLSEELLSLPCHQYLRDDDVREVARELRSLV